MYRWHIFKALKTLFICICITSTHTWLLLDEIRITQAELFSELIHDFTDAIVGMSFENFVLKSTKAFSALNILVKNCSRACISFSNVENRNDNKWLSASFLNLRFSRAKINRIWDGFLREDFVLTAILKQSCFSILPKVHWKDSILYMRLRKMR